MAEKDKLAMGDAAFKNIKYKFGGDFRKGSTPTLLDSSQAQIVKAFIENMVFHSKYQIVTGDTAQTRFHIDFTHENLVVFDLMIPTALKFDEIPTLGGDLILSSQDIIANVAESKFRQYKKEGFVIHPQNMPSDTAAGFESVLKLFGWDSGTPYSVGLRAPAASSLSGSSSLDSDNSLTWILPFEDGTANQVLATDGSRTLSFIDASGFTFDFSDGANSFSVDSGDTITFSSSDGSVTIDCSSSDTIDLTASGGGGGGSITVGDGSTTVSSATSLKFSDDCVSNPSTGVARVLTGRPINLYTTGNGQKTGGPVTTYTGATANSEDYHFRAGDGMKLIGNGSGSTDDELQFEVLKTEVATDGNSFDFRCGDRLAFKGGNGIATSYTAASYPYWVNFNVSDDVMQSISGISAAGNNFDINSGNGITITGGTAAITIDADVRDIQAGSGISVSESSGTYTITNTGGGGGGGGGVSSVDITSSNGTIDTSGGPITSSGTLDIDLPNQGTSGTYTSADITVDDYGIITSVSSGSGGGGGSGTVTSVSAESSLGSLDVNTSTGGAITTSGTITIDLPTTGTNGSYTNADITVNDYGIITSVSSGSVSGTLFDFQDPDGNSFNVSGGDTIDFFSTDSSVTIDCSSSGSIGLSLTNTPMTSFNFDDPDGNSFTVSDSDTVSFFSTDSSITIDTSSSGSIGLSVAGGGGLSSFDVYDDSGNYWTLDSSSSDFYFTSSDGFIAWDCSSSNYADAYSGSSDERLKENIKPLEGSAEKVAALRAVEFDWTDEREVKFAKKRTGTAHDFGFIAQEVEKVVPEVVGERQNGMKTINYAKVVPLLLDVIQDLSKRVEDLESKAL